MLQTSSGRTSAVQSEHLPGRLLESRTEAHGLCNQAGIVSVLEDGSNPLDFVPQSDRPPCLRDRATQTFEVVCCQVIDETLHSERISQTLAGGVQLAERARGDLTGFQEMFFGGHKPIGEVAERQALPVYSGCTASQQVVFLVEPQLQGCFTFRVVCDLAEILDLAAYLFGPVPASMGKQGKVRWLGHTRARGLDGFFLGTFGNPAS